MSGYIITPGPSALLTPSDQPYEKKGNVLNASCWPIMAWWLLLMHSTKSPGIPAWPDDLLGINGVQAPGTSHLSRKYAEYFKLPPQPTPWAGRVEVLAPISYSLPHLIQMSELKLNSASWLQYINPSGWKTTDFGKSKTWTDTHIIYPHHLTHSFVTPRYRSIQNAYV